MNSWGRLMSVTDTRRPKPQRGFVLLIVLMVLIALSTAVILSYESAALESVASIRERDQALARALAETCLDRAMKHARSVIDGAGTPDPDLDRILDPNLNTNANDDYIPAANDGVVYVPNNGTDPLRRFAVFRDRGGTHGELANGGCLVRFDDNMDDQLPGLIATTVNNIPEGPSAGQVLNRDRDGVVTVTAIGLYPVFASTADADLYERAHARSTLKGLVNVEVSYASSVPTVHVGNDVDVANGASHNAVCGAGGALYDDLHGMTPSQGDRWGVCGQIDDDGQPPPSTPGVPDSHMCPNSLVGTAACEPQAPSPNANSNPLILDNHANRPTRRTIAGAPSVTTDWPFYEGLGRSAGGNYRQDDPFNVGLGSYPGGGDACVFYYTEPGYRGGVGYGGSNAARVWVWDRTATDAAASLTLAANNVNSVTGPATTLNENCQATIAKRAPCRWSWDAPNNRWDVQCNAGESPCWKLVADLDGTGGGYLQNEDANTGPLESTLVNSGVEVFQPVADRDIPFVDNIAAGSWNALCRLGGPAGLQIGTPGERGFGWATDHFELRADIEADTWPGNKAIHIFHNGTSVTRMVRLPNKFGDDGGSPIQHAIIARGSVEFTDEVYACCPRCDCSSFNPDDWDDFSITSGPELMDTGYFLFSGTYVFFDSSNIKGVRGDIYAKNIHIDSNAHINGDLFGFGNCTMVSTVVNYSCGGQLKSSGSYAGYEKCDSPGSSDGLFETFADVASVCMRDNNVIVGSIAGYRDVSMHNGNAIVNRESHGRDVAIPLSDWGAIVAWDVWMKENNNIIGRIIAEDDFAMKKHNRIHWPGATGGLTAPTITNVELRVSEQTW
jgi:hypothetical protein